MLRTRSLVYLAVVALALATVHVAAQGPSFTFNEMLCVRENKPQRCNADCQFVGDDILGPNHPCVREVLVCIRNCGAARDAAQSGAPAPKPQIDGASTGTLNKCLNSCGLSASGDQRKFGTCCVNCHNAQDISKGLYDSGSGSWKAGAQSGNPQILQNVVCPGAFKRQAEKKSGPPVGSAGAVGDTCPVGPPPAGLSFLEVAPASKNPWMALSPAHRKRCLDARNKYMAAKQKKTNAAPSSLDKKSNAKNGKKTNAKDAKKTGAKNAKKAPGAKDAKSPRTKGKSSAYRRNQKGQAKDANKRHHAKNGKFQKETATNKAGRKFDRRTGQMKAKGGKKAGGAPKGRKGPKVNARLPPGSVGKKVCLGGLKADKKTCACFLYDSKAKRCNDPVKGAKGKGKGKRFF